MVRAPLTRQKQPGRHVRRRALAHNAVPNTDRRHPKMKYKSELSPMFFLEQAHPNPELRILPFDLKKDDELSGF
jgi:hypothetical protein